MVHVYEFIYILDVLNPFEAFSMFVTQLALSYYESSKHQSDKQKYISRSEAIMLPKVLLKLCNKSGNLPIYEIMRFYASET
jgi:hypothetical protein